MSCQIWGLFTYLSTMLCSSRVCSLLLFLSLTKTLLSSPRHSLRSRSLSASSPRGFVMIFFVDADVMCARSLIRMREE